MLISLSNKFVFIANPKTASTAIERALRPYSDVALVESRFGKHQSFLEIEARFEWMLSLVDPSELLVFSVMRDPIDFMVSLYNSHMDPKFEAEADLYTGTLHFEDFLNKWTQSNDDQSRQQHTRMLDGDNRIAANYIIAYDNLEDGLRFVGERIGVDNLVPLGRENESHGRFDRASLTAAQHDRIEDFFVVDRKVLDRYCGRLLTSRPILPLDDFDVKKDKAKPIEGLRCSLNILNTDDPLSAHDVEMAYEFILGRKPENATVVASHLKNSLTHMDLRTVLMASEEHRARICRELGIMTPTCGAVLMDEIDGVPLTDAYGRFSEPDRLICFINQYLQIADKFQKRGMFHNDMTAHNLKVSEDGKIYAIDFERAEQSCCADPFAVMLWTVHDILAGQAVSYDSRIYGHLCGDAGMKRADRSYYPNFSGMTLAAPLRLFITRAENHPSWPDFVASELQSDRLNEAVPDSVSSATTSSAVSERDVQLAYEFILGRAAESASVLAEHVKHRLSRQDLRTVLMASAEHRAQLALELGAVAAKPLGWPKMDIEVEVPTETLTAMIRHIERNWALLGEREPHWSVLTHERFKAGEIEENIDEFYASGEDAVSYFTHAADRAGVNYRDLRRCFELGCGVGRISLRLARIFPELLAVDISAPHLRLAAEAIDRAGLKNVDLRLVDTIGKVEALPTFDCFISIIVLQHNPPPVIAFLLRTILAKLNPGGLAYFQVPTYRKDAVFNAETYIQSAAISGDMEVHVVPQAVVWQLADEANCQVLDVREDGWTGVPDGVSNSILLMKRRS
jgi:SAM-dependent methyltransferase